jgi:hypothetical protein
MGMTNQVRHCTSHEPPGVLGTQRLDHRTSTHCHSADPFLADATLPIHSQRRNPHRAMARPSVDVEDGLAADAALQERIQGCCGLTPGALELCVP